MSDFNLASVSAFLVGTWKFTMIIATQDFGLAHFSDTGLYIQFGDFSALFDPSRILRLRYSVESPTHLRFRPMRPVNDGHLRSYYIQDDTIIISSEERSFTCTRALSLDIPESFHEALAAALSRP